MGRAKFGSQATHVSWRTVERAGKFFFFLNFVRFYLPALLFRGFWLVLRSGQQSALVLGVLGVLEGSALAGFSSRAARSLRSSRLGVYGSPPGAMLCLLAVALNSRRSSSNIFMIFRHV